jgi:hypothetical protein
MERENLFIQEVSAGESLREYPAVLLVSCNALDCFLLFSSHPTKAPAMPNLEEYSLRFMMIWLCNLVDN